MVVTLRVDRHVGEVGEAPRQKCAKNTSSITWYWLKCEELLGNFWPAGDWHHLLIVVRVPSAESGDHSCTGGVTTLGLVPHHGGGVISSLAKTRIVTPESYQDSYPILTYLIQYDTIQYYPILHHTKLYNTIRYNLAPNPKLHGDRVAPAEPQWSQGGENWVACQQPYWRICATGSDMLYVTEWSKQPWNKSRWRTGGAGEGCHPTAVRCQDVAVLPPATEALHFRQMVGPFFFIFIESSCAAAASHVGSITPFGSRWLQWTPPHVTSRYVTLALIKTWCVPNLMSCSWPVAAMALIISFGTEGERGAEGVKQGVHWRWPITGTKPLGLLCPLGRNKMKETMWRRVSGWTEERRQVWVPQTVLEGSLQTL